MLGESLALIRARALGWWFSFACLAGCSGVGAPGGGGATVLRFALPLLSVEGTEVLDPSKGPVASPPSAQIPAVGGLPEVAASPSASPSPGPAGGGGGGSGPLANPTPGVGLGLRPLPGGFSDPVLPERASSAL